MSHSPSAHLFYGYHLPEDVKIPESAADTFCSDQVPVRIGHHGHEFGSSYVALTATDVDADWNGPEAVDLPRLVAELPADADEQIRAFASKHGLPAPGETGRS